MGNKIGLPLKQPTKVSLENLTRKLAGREQDVRTFPPPHLKVFYFSTRLKVKATCKEFSQKCNQTTWL